jgi:hypothetical protein
MHSILLNLWIHINNISLHELSYNLLPIDTTLTAKQSLQLEGCASYLAIYFVIKQTDVAQGDDAVHVHPTFLRFCMPATSISCRRVTKDLEVPFWTLGSSKQDVDIGTGLVF